MLSKLGRGVNVHKIKKWFRLCDQPIASGNYLHVIAKRVRFICKRELKFSRNLLLWVMTQTWFHKQLTLVRVTDCPKLPKPR